MTVTDCEGTELTWDVGGPREPDLQAVDVVTRLALLVRRGGGSIRLTQMGIPMRDLLDLAGMTAEMRCQDDEWGRSPGCG